MAKKEVQFTVKIKTEGGKLVTESVNSLDKLKKSVSDVRTEMDKAPIGSKAWKNLQKDLKASEAALKKAEQASMSLGQRLASIDGPIGTAVKGIQGFGTALKTLAANPFIAAATLLVGAITAIFKAFTSTKKGGEQLKQVMAGLGAVMDVFRDLLVKVAELIMPLFDDPIQAIKDFGKAIVQNIVNRLVGILELIPNLTKAVGLLFSGEFAEAGRVAANAVGKVVTGLDDTVGTLEKVGEQIKDTFNEALTEGKKAAQIEKLLQGVADAERALRKERAEQNKVIAAAKLIINDETKSYEERLAALKEAGAAEQALAEKEAKIAKQRYDAIVQRNSLSDSSIEALDEEAAAYEALQNAQTASLLKQKEIADQTKALNDRQKAETKALNDAIINLRKSFNAGIEETDREKREREAKEQYEANLRTIEELKTTEEQKNQLKLEALDAYYTQKETIDKQESEKELQKAKDDAKNLSDARIEIYQRQLDGALALSRQAKEKEIQILDEQYQQEIAMSDGSEQAISDINAKYAAIRAEIDWAYQKGRLEGFKSVFDSIASLYGDESAIGKAAAIASTIISTYASAQESYKALAGIPIVGPVLGGIAAGVAVASGLKRVQQIKAIKPEEKADGGIVYGPGTSNSDSVPALLSSGESVITASSTAAFAPLLSTINQLGGGSSFDNTAVMNSNAMDNSMRLMGALGKNGGQPVRAYVLTTDVENTTQFERRVQSRSTL